MVDVYGKRKRTYFTPRPIQYGSKVGYVCDAKEKQDEDQSVCALRVNRVEPAYRAFCRTYFS